MKQKIKRINRYIKLNQYVKLSLYLVILGNKWLWKFSKIIQCRTCLESGLLKGPYI